MELIVHASCPSEFWFYRGIQSPRERPQEIATSPFLGGEVRGGGISELLRTHSQPGLQTAISD